MLEETEAGAEANSFMIEEEDEQQKVLWPLLVPVKELSSSMCNEGEAVVVVVVVVMASFEPNSSSWFFSEVHLRGRPLFLSGVSQHCCGHPRRTHREQGLCLSHAL